jgi:tRNA-uridine aminocarboxypropyltransferase
MASEGRAAARGYRLLRCSTCYLPLDGCICACTPTIHTPAQFWLLIHPEEYRKSTNTARLIGASIPHTRFFSWYRTTPPAGLIALLGDRRFMPYLLVPQGDATLFERLRERPWLPDRVPAFVLLDGTWSQATKMLHRSPYLQGLPRIAIQPRAPSTYRLRCQRCAQHLSTVEVAIALLEQLEEVTASSILHAYFRVFAERCMAARHGHLLKKSLPEMAQLLAYNSHYLTPAPDDCPLHPGKD